MKSSNDYKVLGFTVLCWLQLTFSGLTWILLVGWYLLLLVFPLVILENRDSLLNLQ